ncbi:MAG: alpha/beta fold hydrolase [Methylocella sp.]
MKTHMIETPNGRIAAHESAGQGPAAVLIHGNSSSSRAFSKQLDGPLGERFRLVAIDLPGHGASDDARDPALYSLRNHARSLRGAIDAFGLADARLVGWSMGGHLALELAPDLPRARGFFIFGTPPLALPPAMELAFLPHPAMGAGSAETIDRRQAAAYVASFFAPGFSDVPAFFVEDALRADGRARAGVNASVRSGGYRDEAVVVRELAAPLAVLHGARDQLVNGAYFATLTMPTLWRGAVQTIPGAGHAPQWETPQAFDALLASFLEETG